MSLLRMVAGRSNQPPEDMKNHIQNLIFGDTFKDNQSFTGKLVPGPNKKGKLCN